MKTAFWTLPNSITLLNALCGSLILYLVMVWRDDLSTVLIGGALLILCGGVFDYLDGYIARRTGSVSVAGEILDSFADLLTFCVAPAVLLTRMIGHHPLVIFVCVLPIMCGVIRLTRFMILAKESGKVTTYQGLSTTLFGLISAVFLLAIAQGQRTTGEMNMIVYGAICLSLLMITWSCRYPKYPTSRQRFVLAMAVISPLIFLFVMPSLFLVMAAIVWGISGLIFRYDLA